ncbi:MAG: hypothetical protein FJX76_05195 [Armatimonadetes bacterium]|nr:hypothetical protein [Armatimonadota bacterium]
MSGETVAPEAALHFAACHECARRVGELSALRKATRRAVESEAVPPGLQARVTAGMRRRAPRPVRVSVLHFTFGGSNMTQYAEFFKNTLKGFVTPGGLSGVLGAKAALPSAPPPGRTAAHRAARRARRASHFDAIRQEALALLAESAPRLAAAIAVALGLSLLLGPAPPEVALETPSPSAVAVVPLPPMSALAKGILNDHTDHGNLVAAGNAEPLQEQDKVIGMVEKRLGQKLAIPADVRGFQREQCHLCPVGSEDVPHIAYRQGNRAMSLFVVSQRDLKMPISPGSLYITRFADENLVAWRSGDAVFLLISREPQDTLAGLAAAFPH